MTHTILHYLAGFAALMLVVSGASRVFNTFDDHVPADIGWPTVAVGALELVVGVSLAILLFVSVYGG